MNFVKRSLLSIFFLLSLVFLDQTAKYFVINYIGKSLQKFSVLGNFIGLTYAENPGIAFGLLSTLGKKTINLFILIVFLIILLFIFKKTHSSKSKFIYIFISAGAISNFLDRIIRGFVVDYIKLAFFPPIFNLADVYIVMGTVFLILEIIFSYNSLKIENKICLDIKK